MVNYPASIDNSISLPAAVDNTTPVQAIVVNRLRTAILAIQTELGVKPSGIDTTVRNRLDLLEENINLLSNSATLTGDLGGTSTDVKVIGIQGNPINSTSPTDYQVLTWVDADGYWAPKSFSSFMAGGDLTGNSTNQTVIGLQTISVSSDLPEDGYVLTYDLGSSSWKPLPIPSSLPSGAAGGDLSGTYPNPTVSKLQGFAVSATTPTDGYVLTWDQGGNNWISAPSSGFTAGGDLSGTSSNQTVIKIQGNPVEVATYAAAQDGYVLTWVNGSSQIKMQPTPVQTATGSAGGDLSGTYPNPTVIKINGASVPIAGSLTTGNVLQVSGSSALSYGALNLAGGSNYVTGVLPTVNQAAQSLSGDLSGTTASATVIRLQNVDVSSTAPTDGYVLTYELSTTSWKPKPSAGSGFTAGGDLSGTSSSQTVEKIKGTTITTAGGALPVGAVLRTTAVGTADWGTVDLSDTDAVSGILPSGNQAAQTVGGDLSGTTSSSTVIKIQNVSINSVSPTDGYVLTYLNSDGYWAPRPAAGGSPSGSAGGNLSGTYPNPTVVKLQNVDISAIAPTDGYVLTYESSSTSWKSKPLYVQNGGNYGKFLLINAFPGITSTDSTTFVVAGTFEFNKSEISDGYGTREIKLRVIGETTSPLMTIQLYNLTTASVVSGSTLTTTSVIPVLLTTNDLSANLSSGLAIYQVQIKMDTGSVSDQVILGMATLRIDWT